jgi:hypothetical protein
MQALDWAIDHEVDIINCSFVLYSADTELRKRIATANSKGIAIICSTADEGHIRQAVWPAKYAETEAVANLFPVAACDELGKVASYSSELFAKFLFQGENVDVSAPGSSAASLVSGSSVATAMATGIISVILGCERLHTMRHSSKVEHQLAKDVTKKALTHMCEADSHDQKGPKFIQSGLVFPKREKTKYGSETSQSDYTLEDSDSFKRWLVKFNNIGELRIRPLRYESSPLTMHSSQRLEAFRYTTIT